MANGFPSRIPRHCHPEAVVICRQSHPSVCNTEETRRCSGGGHFRALPLSPSRLRIFPWGVRRSACISAGSSGASNEDQTLRGLFSCAPRGKWVVHQVAPGSRKRLGVVGGGFEVGGPHEQGRDAADFRTVEATETCARYIERQRLENVSACEHRHPSARFPRWDVGHNRAGLKAGASRSFWRVSACGVCAHLLARRTLPPLSLSFTFSLTPLRVYFASRVTASAIPKHVL